MDLEMIALSQSDREDKYHMIQLHVESRIWHSECILEQTQRHREQTSGYQTGRQGKDWEFWISRCQLYYIG